MTTIKNKTEVWQEDFGCVTSDLVTNLRFLALQNKVYFSCFSRLIECDIAIKTAFLQETLKMRAFLKPLVILGTCILSTMQPVCAGEIVTDKNGNKIQLNDDKTWHYVDDPTQDLLAIKQSVLGLSMAGNFEAAFDDALRIKDMDERDLVLLSMWNFTVQKSDCDAMGTIVDSLSNAGKRLVFGMNHKSMCPD